MRPPSVPALARVGRAPLAVLVAALVVLSIALGLTLSGGSGTSDPAARLVPDSALVYVHLRTDPGNGDAQRAAALARTFPGYARLRGSLLRRLTAGGSNGGSISGWLGGDAALALLDTGGGSAASLLVLSVRDSGKAHAYVNAGSSGPSQSYRGVTIQPYGRLAAAFAGGDLLIGEPATLRRAIDLSRGRGRALAADPTFARAVAGLPSSRVLDAYVTGAGVGELLRPAGGLLGLAGTLLTRPGVRATALSLDAEAPGALLTVHSLGGGGGAGFTPTLAGAAPGGSLAFLDVQGANRLLSRALLAAGSASSGLIGLVAAVRNALGTQGGAAVTRELVAPLRGETALVLTSHVPAPILTIVAPTRDVAGARAALARLAAPLRRSLRNATVQSQTIAGQPAEVLRIGSGAQLAASAFAGRLVISTAPQGIAAIARAPRPLAGDPTFRAVAPLPGHELTALAFLDFQQLLTLAERTGLDSSPAFLSLRADLRRVRAVGATSWVTGQDTTTEIRFQIR